MGLKATTAKYPREMTDNPCRGIHFPQVLKTQGTSLPILFWCLPRKYMPISVNQTLPALSKTRLLGCAPLVGTGNNLTPLEVPGSASFKSSLPMLSLWFATNQTHRLL